MLASDIDRLCKERDWKRAQLLLRLRAAGRRHGQELPGDESLRRMVREWASGRRQISTMYADLLGEVFGVPFSSSPTDTQTERADELASRLTRVQASVDLEMIELFEGQTQSFRMLDRRLGATRILIQCEAHITQMSELLTYCLPGQTRSLLAVAVAEAAALAGWQALDLGHPDKAWSLHEIAKNAARDSGNPTVIAHVTAQQAYALLDLDRNEDAYRQINHVRQEAGTRVPDLMQAWLWAAEAEAAAATGNREATHRALDQAGIILPNTADDELPFVALNSAHLTRWRGSCLARLGADEAVTDLTDALAEHDVTFARAAAGLHTDLALAYAVRGEKDAAHASATEAARLAELTASMRQKRRLAKIREAAS